jgi:enoyl-CoA hydratase
MGLVNRVVPPEKCLDEAMVMAKEIADRSPVAVRVAKEAVLRAFETGLTDGLDYERKMFYMLFATEDQKEGMKAFMEKRKAQYTGK